MANNTAQLAPGTLLKFGTYRIVRYISHGGFGCTYEAEHIALQARVAIKEFFVQDFCNRDDHTGHVSVGTESKRELVEKLRGKFLAEARAVFALEHPNIVKVTDVFEENGTAYFVMNYIEGCSLADLTRTAPLPEAQALKYIRQVCDALSYVHSQNRLHLDIKPSNIMVDKSDNAILIDFGTSKQYEEVSGENTSTVLGYTPGYAPLEQCTHQISHFLSATDIYALGATLYKILSGVTPPESVLLASEMAELSPLPDSISSGTRKAVKAAMNLSKNKRPQGVAEFVAMLGTPAPVSAATPQHPSVPTKPFASTGDNDGLRKHSNDPRTIIDDPTPNPNPNPNPRMKWLLAACFIIVGILIGVGVNQCSDAGEGANIGEDTARVAEVVVADSCIADLCPGDTASTPETEELSISEPTGYHNGYGYVDLGLSVNWATCNVGAYSPSGYGNYYAWGETSTKSEYTDSNSQTYRQNIGDIGGTSRDAARVNWGGGWRLPNKAECEELKDRCSWTWTGPDEKGCRVTRPIGYIVTGPNGNSIFFPAAGCRYEISTDNVGNEVSFWSSTPHNSTEHAFYFYFDHIYPYNGGMCGGYRNWGHPVRPVLSKAE